MLSSNSTPALALLRTLLRVLIILNAAGAVLLVCAFVGSFVFEAAVANYYRARSMDPAILIPTLRIWMLIGAPYMVAVHVLLSRLLAMAETVQAGTPFTPDNAARLKTMAWCLFAMQLLHLAFGAFVGLARAANAQVDWSFSIDGWIAVLLLFVLARIFEEAATIRDDLEKMI